jgi:hypothetical protein
MSDLSKMTLPELAHAYDFGHGFTRGHVLDELARRQRMLDAAEAMFEAIKISSLLDSHNAAHAYQAAKETP